MQKCIECDNSTESSCFTCNRPVCEECKKNLGLIYSKDLRVCKSCKEWWNKMRDESDPHIWGKEGEESE